MLEIINHASIAIGYVILITGLVWLLGVPNEKILKFITKLVEIPYDPKMQKDDEVLSHLKDCKRYLELFIGFFTGMFAVYCISSLPMIPTDSAMLTKLVLAILGACATVFYWRDPTKWKRRLT